MRNAARHLLALTFVFAVTASAARADERDQFYDGLVTDAAAVPSAGTLRFSAIGGGGMLGLNSSDSSLGSIGGLYGFSAFSQRFAVMAQGVYEPGTKEKLGLSNSMGPSLGLRWQYLRQSESGLNLGASLRYKAVGFNFGSSELELGFAGGRNFGNFSLVGNAVVGKELNDDGADVEARVGGLYSIVSAFSVGFEGRLRTGIEPDKIITTPRSFDVVAGPSLALNFGPLRLQGLAGYGLPRYQQSAGFFGLLSLTANIFD